MKAFPPGHWAEFNVMTKEFKMHTYYSLYPRELTCQRPTMPLDELANDADYLAFCSQIEESLTQAVRKRFMSDRPIGCILSGGLDSTTVTAIACKLLKEMNPTAPPMRTYTVGLAGGEDFKWARKAA